MRHLKIPTLHERWLLALLTLAGLLLRLWGLADKGLAYDEAATALMARATAAEIIAFHWRAAFEHPPLWQLTMAGWSAIFGQNEAALRLLPALAGAAAIPLTWWWVRRLWPAEQAQRNWAAALVALSPTLVLYSQEARMYTLVVALALLSLIALHALVQRPRAASFCAFAASNWLMTGFHYYSVLLIGVEALFLGVLAARRRGGQEAGRWLAAIMLGLLPIVLWMVLAPGFHDTLRVVVGNAGSDDALSALAFLDALWRDLTFGAIRWQPAVAIVGLALAPLVVIGLAATTALDARRFRDQRNHAPWSWLVGLAALLPLTLSILFAPALAARYILFVLPAIYVLAAAGIVWLGRQSLSLGLAGALLALVVAWLGLSYYFTSYTKSEYREMAAFLVAHRQPDEAVMLYAPRQHLLAKYYLPGITEFATAPAVELPPFWPVNAPPVVPEAMDDVILALLRAHPALWVIISAENEVDRGEFVPKFLTAVAYKEECWSWLDVNLCRYVSPHFLAEAQATAPDVLFGGDLRLAGAAIMQTPGNALDAGYRFVRLDWRAERKPTLDYRVTLRIVDNDGAVVAQRDEFPIGALLPPTTWNAGDAKPGYMALPADLSPGDYRVIVGVYDPATGAALGDFVEIGVIAIGGS
jgi:4-amino-4-deoxy-L-arabinose transferase-like glycosyltransferase